MASQKTFRKFLDICETRVPVTRQSGDFNYPGKTGEEKGLPKAKRLSTSQNPADRRRGNKIRKRLEASADRETARASSDARQQLYRSQQRRANDLAQQNIELRNKLGEDFELDEIAQVPAGKKLTYKGGEPLPPVHQKSLNTIGKMNRGIYPDPKPKPKPKPEPESPEQQTPRRNRFQFVDRSNASTQGNTNTRRGRGGSRFEEVELDEILMVTPMKTGKTKSKRKPSGSLSKPDPTHPRYVELMRQWVKAKQMQREEIENFDEGIGMAVASALGTPPLRSKRLKLKQALIQREIEKNIEKNKRRRFSGKAADPNVPRRGPRARNSGDQNANRKATDPNANN